MAKTRVVQVGKKNGAFQLVQRAVPQPGPR